MSSLVTIIEMSALVNGFASDSDSFASSTSHDLNGGGVALKSCITSRSTLGPTLTCKVALLLQILVRVMQQKLCNTRSRWVRLISDFV